MCRADVPERPVLLLPLYCSAFEKKYGGSEPGTADLQLFQATGSYTMTETRRAPRHRVLKAGTIEFGGGAIDCTVRNLSSTGAALQVSNQIGIPEKFALVVPADGMHRSCHVVWRKENRIGVIFDGVGGPPS
jgi:hypothetical protein